MCDKRQQRPTNDDFTYILRDIDYRHESHLIELRIMRFKNCKI